MNWIARIVMALFGLGLLAGLLLALGVYSVYAALRWLLTGRKPQVVLVWQQFSALRRGTGMRWRPNTGFESPRQDDVVDVQAREIHEASPRLPGEQT